MEGFGEKLKKVSQVAIAAAGAFFPSPSVDQAPEAQGTEMTGAEVSEDGTQGEVLAGDSPSESEAAEGGGESTEWKALVEEMSPEDAAAQIGNPELSYNQSVDLLDKAMTLPLSDEDREALLKEFFMANANEGGYLEFMTKTLEKLTEYGIDPTNTPWIVEYVEDIFLNNPEVFVPDRTYGRITSDGQTEDIPSPWLQYNPLSYIAERSGDPRVHSVIQILENDYEPAQKRRLTYFADDIASGQISLEDAAAIAADREVWVRELTKKAVNNPSERLFVALDEVATDEEKERVLSTIPNYREWAADQRAELDQYAETLEKREE